MSTKSKQYNSPYLLQLLNITFQYKSEFQFLSLCHKKLLSNFPEYLSMAKCYSWVVHHGNQMDNGLLNSLIIGNR